MLRRYVHDTTTRAAQREQLQQIGASIVAEVPGAAIAADQIYRETDLAIDYCEDVARLSRAAVDRIVALMRAHNLTAKVSSIHVNGWFGAYDKLAMTKRLMREEFGAELDRAREHYVFVGDSPNDAPMFSYFPHAVGVANIREFAGRLEHEPKYVTIAASGAGFCEVADLILAAKT
jgi:HAD superfamily hydrolase (TIGR01484 family)